MNRLIIVVCFLQGILLTNATQAGDLFFKHARGIGKRTTCTLPSFSNDYTDLDDFNNQALEWHNYFRCQHGLSNMVLDSDLRSAAQAWAENVAGRLLTTWNSPPMHSEDRCNAGENVWLGYGAYNYAAWRAIRGDATQSSYGYGWYCSEESSYDWGQSPAGYQSAAGHFSQVIWRDSTSLGCGVAQTSGGTPDKTIVVCQYSPPGNLQSSGCWAGANSAMEPLKSGVTSADVCPSSNS